MDRSTAAPARPPPRPWMEREEAECAWPIGAGRGMLSCCAPVIRLPSGRRASYCRRHWKAMWKPAPPADAGSAR